MRVVVLPAFSDNYIYALVDPAGSRAAVVDPGEAGPVLEFLERESLSPALILLTHHHGDHVGGVKELAERFPGVRVVGAARDARRLPRLTESVSEGDVVEVFGRRARVLDVPGHTLGHVAYFIPDDAGAGELFSGDTVFGATIGNLFEGTPEDMYGSLVKIRALPPGTRIWCGHEYTLQYVRDAARFDLENQPLAERLHRLEAAAATGGPTVPLTLEEECATSPFFRWDAPELLRKIGTPPGLPAFRRLCDLL